ncbi:MAG: potassium channel family protein [Thermodesulfobium sp.]
MIKLILGHIKREISLVFFILLFGTFGYMFLEHYDPIQALFMTVITITTVGYEEVRPLDNVGMLFSIMLILSSFGIFAFAISRIIDYLIGTYPEERETIKMENKLKSLKGHIIVCGFGRMGSVVAKELRKNKKDIVVIESNSQACELAKKDGFLTIEGNATNDEILMKAEVKEAKSIIAVTSSESDNGFISLSAKKLNPKISVISRASNAEWISKLHLAGADEVISPHTFGARRIVNFILNPGVVEFLDILRDENIDIFMEELAVKPNSMLDGKTFASWEELRLFLDVPSLIPLTFCIEKYNKCPHNEEFTLKESDKVIIIGSKSDIERVNKLVFENNK